ncbi:SARP family transcriptional regulator, regulator of embCAB operon [Frankia sp. AiPs1]|uniref:AfsR/SARP family transcriptional regulator n=1 Tax=Frankia sp. AiPa1 TaxID=573492 RepID=UPI00202B3F10|nr:BTAD domain-containing putative transcriptional regulator [Frankia sp. AiPa1]MCL9762950.1 AfsR/SARP family transcriptional regulator [Frankia sp. AiPa1]
MRYEILGEIRVTDGDGEFSLTATKVEILLATLVARAGQVVSAGQIFGELWPGARPRQAAAGVHVYVYHLRKFLRQPRGASMPVVTRAPGYLLQLGDDLVDVREFQRLRQEGRARLGAGRHGEAVELFEAALGLWRGQAFGGLRGGPIINNYATWLEESRLECLEFSIEAKLFLGRHHELLSQLYELVSEHPQRESFYRHLAVALHRDDRRADAVRVSRRAAEVCGAYPTTPPTLGVAPALGTPPAPTTALIPVTYPELASC